MRVLMVIQSGFGSNPFVLSLIDGLVKYGHDVEYGLDRFWDSYTQYDLLFFQWPEAIFDWKKDKIDIEKLANHFDCIKQTGIKTMITCHNLRPHNNDAKAMVLYELVYSRMDAFHHLGKTSYRLFKDKYPDRCHFIAPHHISDSLLDNPISPSEAKKELHIPKNNIVISSFGAFRNAEEVGLCVNMIKDIPRGHMSFLIPRIPMGRFYNGRHFYRSIRYLFRCFFYWIIGIRHSGFLTDKDLNIWLSASDIVFIQRKEILNSGNLPLAFAGGKVVVGPDLGNVGEILRETGNFVFDPQDRSSVKRAVLDAIDEVRRGNGLGARNYQYAKENWTTSKVCGQISRELFLICHSC